MKTAMRWLRHVHTGGWCVRRCFSTQTLQAIEHAVASHEKKHSGELRFVVEPALSQIAVLRGVTPRQRAEQVFCDLRVWDTAHNDGVLIYVLLADHAVEMVADRGVARGHVPQADWDAACRVMEQHFRQQHFEAGAVAGVQAVSAILERYPAGPRDVGNELPNAPKILR